jgi:hypothetical protein
MAVAVPAARAAVAAPAQAPAALVRAQAALARAAVALVPAVAALLRAAVARVRAAGAPVRARVAPAVAQGNRHRRGRSCRWQRRLCQYRWHDADRRRNWFRRRGRPRCGRNLGDRRELWDGGKLRGDNGTTHAAAGGEAHGSGVEPWQLLRWESHGDQLGKPGASQTFIKALHAAGFNTLRLPLTWTDHIGAVPTSPSTRPG